MDSSGVSSISPALKTRVDILRRACHVVTLIQNGSDPFDWNRSTLSDAFTGESLTDNLHEEVPLKQVTGCVRLHMDMFLPMPF